MSKKAKVADVISPYSLVLNVGLEDGVSISDRFLIIGYGKDIKDPDTGESLGNLEIERGTGRVAHVQSSMCTVVSDMWQRYVRRIQRQEGRNTVVEEIPSRRQNEFRGVQIGDVAFKLEEDVPF